MLDKRRGIALLLGAVLAVAGILVAGTPAEAATYHEIPNSVNHKCLDNALEEPLKLQIWKCTGGSEQLWQQVWYFDGDFYHNGTFQLQNKWEGRCTMLRHPDFFVPPVGMGACFYYDYTQFWRIYFDSGSYQVVQNLYTGWCLAVDGNSSSNGTRLVVAPCDINSPAQQWRL